MTEDFDAAQLATRWLAAEPDDDIRDELQALIEGDPAALTERFSGRLTFGTAGLRATGRRRAVADESPRRAPGRGWAGQLPQGI